MSNSLPYGPMVGIAVGSPHPLWPILPKTEGMHARYQSSAIDLIIVLHPCSDGDIRSFRNDGLKFGLVRLNGGYVWLLRTAFASFDAPYSPGLEPPEGRAWSWSDSGPTSETRAAINMHVVDGQGIARAIKLVTVSPDFTRRLASIHTSSLRANVTISQWTAEFNAHCRRYPNPKDAFSVACVTSKGGA